MPIACTRATYRLLVEIPFTVSFPSIVYRVDWVTLPHERRLMLHPQGTDGGYVIATFPPMCAVGSLYGGGALEHTPEQVRAFNFSAITVNVPSVADTILRKLVRDGRAQRIAPEDRNLATDVLRLRTRLP